MKKYDFRYTSEGNSYMSVLDFETDQEAVDFIPDFEHNHEGEVNQIYQMNDEFSHVGKIYERR